MSRCMGRALFCKEATDPVHARSPVASFASSVIRPSICRTRSACRARLVAARRPEDRADRERGERRPSRRGRLRAGGDPLRRPQLLQVQDL